MHRPLTKEAPETASEASWILDTSAILNGAWSAHAVVCLTTPGVAGEFSPGGRSWAQFERLVAAGMKIQAPSAGHFTRTKKEADRLGETRLSTPDLETAALAVEKSQTGEAVCVVTDDYALQNLLTHLGLPWQGAREQGIKQVRRYRLRCTGCGRWYDPEGVHKAGTPCPVCGLKIERKRARS